MSMFCFRMDRHEMDDCYAKDSDANEELHDGVDLRQNTWSILQRKRCSWQLHTQSFCPSQPAIQLGTSSINGCALFSLIIYSYRAC